MAKVSTADIQADFYIGLTEHYLDTLAASA